MVTTDGLLQQIEDWRNRGVISDAVALTLRSDLAAGALQGGLQAPERQNRFSFLQVLAVFAGISFAAAILVFISANWEAIPRLVRVAGIFAVILAGFAGGALAHNRGGRYGRLVEEAFYLVGGAGFVGGIALVGQMYHLSGELADAMLVYGAGLGIAGLLVRSPVLGMLAVGALAWWHVNLTDAADLISLHALFFVAAMAVAFVAARAGRHRWLQRAVVVALVAGLSPSIWRVLEAIGDIYDTLPNMVQAGFWIVLFAAGIAMLSVTRRGKIAAGWVGPRLGFAVSLFALFGMHLEADTLFPVAVAGLAGVGLALVVLFWHGAASRGLRFAGYALFVAEVLWLYGVTVYSLLGTAGFFFVLGLALAGGALAIYGFEKRIAARNRKKEVGEGR